MDGNFKVEGKDDEFFLQRYIHDYGRGLLEVVIL